MARRFGNTWWGKEWIAALETSLSAEAGRLSRGRTYARQGRVSLPEILPGSVRAEVSGQEEYVADLSIKVLDDDDWDQIAGLIASKSGHAAALLSGELPAQLLSDAQELGVAMLPVSGDVLADCSCPDWGDPCKHAASLAYLVADAIDEDPFVLLLLRGRGRTDLLDAVRARRSTQVHETVGDSEDASDEGVSGEGQVVPLFDRDQPSPASTGTLANGAYERILAPLPTPIPAPDRAGSAISLGTPPPIDAGLRLRELEMLASDAAVRATDLLHQGTTSGLGLTAEQDLARRACELMVTRIGARNPAQALRDAAFVQLADTVGIAANDLLVQAVAWLEGGSQGLHVATQQWQPEAGLVEQARVLLGPRSRVSANQVTGNGSQLRLDEEHCWWRFRPDKELGWILDSQGFREVTELLETD